MDFPPPLFLGASGGGVLAPVLVGGFAEQLAVVGQPLGIGGGEDRAAGLVGMGAVRKRQLAARAVMSAKVSSTAVMSPVTPTERRPGMSRSNQFCGRRTSVRVVVV